MFTSLWAPQGVSRFSREGSARIPLGNADTVEDSADIIQTIRRWKIDNSYIYSIRFLATGDGAHKLDEQLEGTSTDHGDGDGQAT